MDKLTRRSFVGALIAGGAAMIVPRSSRAADSRIEVLVNEPIAAISPEIYGHFVEHLGGVVYDGVWVGENSKIPNVNGVRKSLIEHMQRLKPGVLRWPGGCFADSYDWRDGTGPKQNRPRRTDFWISDGTRNIDAPQVYETNQFGTTDFVRLCKQIGASPYLAANMRSLPAKDFYQWVEYCNAPAGLTTLSKQREADGERDPFGVRYWGVGNESWGCGGNMTPEEYADEFRKFVAWVPGFGVKPAYIASGPNGADAKWTRGFFGRMVERNENALNSVYGWAMHCYCGSTGKRNAIDFPLEEWYELLGKADRMESIINLHWTVMGEVDTRRRVKLIVDEWGAWHARDAQMPETYLWAYPGSLRDALVSGLTLDTFNRHADKVAMANVAQLVNTIHSLFLAHEDKFIATPNFHVFDMYTPHQGAQSLRTIFSSPAVSYTLAGKPASIWGLNGSASIREKVVTLTIVNPHHSDGKDTEVSIRGGSAKSIDLRTLSSSTLTAHNSFEQPHALEPVDSQVAGAGQTLNVHLPAASVNRITINLV